MGQVRVWGLALLAMIAALLVSGPAVAQQTPKRVALIIANGAYEGQPVLANPQTDAALLKPSLERAGFTVRVAPNVDRTRFNEALVQFLRDSNGAQVAMIYFAGHGLQEGGVNWLLPVDFNARDISSDSENLGLDLMAKSHRQLIQAMGAAQIRILVLDACRNNPFAASMPTRGGGTRAANAAQAGLAGVEDRRAVIIMSAEADRIANDGPRDQGSPFARAFADAIDDEGVELSLVFRRIADTVARETAQLRQPQRPKIVGTENLGAQEVYLRGGAPVRVVEAPIGEEAAAFEKCNKEWSQACWQDFLRRFPNGVNLRAAQVIAASFSAAPAPVTPAGDAAVAAALRAMSAADWNGDVGVMTTRLIAQHGKDALERLAQAGDARAQWIVAAGFSGGLGGFADDDRKAVALFKQASDQDFAMAQASLGFMYMNGRGGLIQNDREAVRLYQLAANQDNAIGQANLGFMYAFGRGGLAQNDREAVRLFERAANQDNAIGQANLGFMYLNGRGGLTPNDREAVRLFQLAANQGYAIGQANLGFMYERGGGGLTANRAEAVRLYRLAARQRHAFAQVQLQRLGETW